LLSPYLNLGLLLPGEVCNAVEAAYRRGEAPINSAEGMIRQVAGWREYVWGIYWLWPELEHANALNHRRALPPCFTGAATTDMRCLQKVLVGLDERAYAHHIQRLMILSNFANLYGVSPARLKQWMRERYIDGADWAMEPNVMGMALWADGGRMASKPYVSGGAYIRRMSDFCKGCRFDPTMRTGESACPFTSMYWDFLARHRDRLAGNQRLARQYGQLNRMQDLDETQRRSRAVIRRIRAGDL
jgi:deoxyribodipyrimidine photolyase-related protein